MTTANGFVPTPVKGPPEDQGIVQGCCRLISNVFLLFFYIIEAFVLKFVPSKLRMKSVKDEIVLITGAGSGIGRLMAAKFAALEAKVVCWDINKEGLEETVNNIESKGGIAYSYVCNVADKQAVYSCADQIRNDVGKVSIIVNNAGIVSGKRFLEIPDESIERSFAVNCMAHFWIVKAFLPDMQASNHGHIVSIASLAGQVGVNRLTDYCATKFGAVGFAEALGLELYQEGYTGIHTTVVCPYFINTGMFHGANGGAFSFLEPEYVVNEVVKGVRLNRDFVVLPTHLLPLIALKHWIPSKAGKFIPVELGITGAMFGFNPSMRTKKID